MSGEILLESCCRVSNPSGGMQRNRIHVGISGPIRLELGSMAQFRNRLIETLEPNESKPEGMTESRISR